MATAQLTELRTAQQGRALSYRACASRAFWRLVQLGVA